MNFEKEYSDESFWKKVSSVAKKAGGKAIYIGLLLYYASKRPGIPKWAKVTIYGALGYFISPLDAIPDITPVVGYIDDIGVLVMALATCAAFIDQDIKQQAQSKIKDWFGDEVSEFIIEVDSSLG